MSSELNTRIQHKRGLAADWAKAVNFVPLKAEIIVYLPDETHKTARYKVGDGVTKINDLPFTNEIEGALWQTGNEATNIGTVAFGSNTKAGSKGFTVTAVEDTGNGTGKYTLSSVTGLEVGMPYSVALRIANYNAGTITAIDGNVVTVDGYKHIELNSNTDNVEEYNVYNVFFVVGRPDLGDKEIGFNAQAEGDNTCAHSRASHVEGSNTIGLGQFSHAEGQGTMAGHAAHSEGDNTKALGDSSHAEGFRTEAKGSYSHAEGNDTTAQGQASHSEGDETIAIGWAAHAEGRGLQTKDRTIEISGITVPISLSDLNIKIESIDTTKKTITTSTVNNILITKSIIEEILGQVPNGRCVIRIAPNKESGVYTYIPINGYEIGETGTLFKKPYLVLTVQDSYDEEKNLSLVNLVDYAIIDICQGVSYGEASHIEGYGNLAFADYAHVEGMLNIAEGISAHAEGKTTKALRELSHAEGYRTTASEYAAHAEGNGTTAKGQATHSEGYNTEAIGHYSHAEGSAVTAEGQASHAEGYETLAQGINSHAEGANTQANGTNAHAEGKETVSKGYASHSEGGNTIAVESYSHAEGRSTTASAQGSHAEGYSTIASGQFAHAEGNGTSASGYYAHAEGAETQASSDNAHAEGYGTIANKTNAHAEGSTTTASGKNSHAEGYKSIAEGENAHAEGSESIASGINAHTEGGNTQATGNNSHAEGKTTTASGYGAHAEGGETVASQSYAHAEGYQTKAESNSSHAEGYMTQAVGIGSHAEGKETFAGDYDSHAEGWKTCATEDSSHAEGQETIASGAGAHAEGGNTKASAKHSHAEGYGTESSGYASHAEGGNTTSSGSYSHSGGTQTVSEGSRSFAHGFDLVAKRDNSFVIGEYAEVDSTSIFSVGVGGASERKNAFEVNENGNIYAKQKMFVGGAGATKDSAKEVATLNDVADLKNELLNGAGAAYDTLKELGDLIDENTDALAALEQVAINKADITYVSDQISDVNTKIEELQESIDDNATAIDEILYGKSYIINSETSGIELPELPYNTKVTVSQIKTEALTYMEGELISSGGSIQCDGEYIAIPEQIYSLPYYGYGAGDRYNNVVNFEEGKYYQNSIVFEPQEIATYSDYITYASGLTFEFPLAQYDEWVNAIESIKCSHSELSFNYQEVHQYDYNEETQEYQYSSGGLNIKLNGEQQTSSEQLQTFIDEQRANGTPVRICYGIPEPIVVEIPKTNIQLPAKTGSFVSFDKAEGMLTISTPVKFATKEDVETAKKELGGLIDENTNALSALEQLAVNKADKVYVDNAIAQAQSSVIQIKTWEVDD